MKKGFLIVLAVGFALASNAQTKEVKKEKVEKVSTKKEVQPITFETLVIERKDIPKGSDELFSFKFKNTGKTPVLIQNVQTSCGCTTANKPEAPVAPKKSSEISVKYDTNRVGPFEKTITVTNNVGAPIVLTIKGNVLGESGSEGLAH